MRRRPLPTLVSELHTTRVALPAGDVRYLRAGTGTQVVVLLHPLRAQLDYFGPLVACMDTTRFEVLAPDLPGHGESEASSVDLTADYLTDSVARLLERCDLSEAIVVGESIGASIALTLAARHDPRVAGVVALNPYDYGHRGGIRRSSPLADVLFSAMLWPVIGVIVAHTETRALLRRVLEGGLHDPGALPPDLLDELHRCGSLPGHPRAFRSLMRNWRTWIATREGYAAIDRPVTLVYGEEDWSRPAERAANARAIPGVRTATLERTGHFSCLERPHEIARLITDAASGPEPERDLSA
jgi:pimeloyl-ACP methyl ester carboxylesterase